MSFAYRVFRSSRVMMTKSEMAGRLRWASAFALAAMFLGCVTEKPEGSVGEKTPLVSITIAYPAELAVLPNIRRCRVLGATTLNVTNVFVNGNQVKVHPGGAWTTMVDVIAGVNTVKVSDGGSEIARTFKVAPLAVASKDMSLKPQAEKVYAKLAYAADVPRLAETGRVGRLVALDAGHGGDRDCGALSPHGWAEKDANLLLAKALKGELSRRGYRVLMTREDDRAVQLLERPRLAHTLKADAFISLHHNAPNADGDAGSIRYQAVFAWNDLGEQLAKNIAARQHSRVQRANFAVTRSPEIPSVLIEEDFITHPDGERDSWNRMTIAARARAIADGVDDYFSSLL